MIDQAELIKICVDQKLAILESQLSLYKNMGELTPESYKKCLCSIVSSDLFKECEKQQDRLYNILAIKASKETKGYARQLAKMLSESGASASFKKQLEDEISKNIEEMVIASRNKGIVGIGGV